MAGYVHAAVRDYPTTVEHAMYNSVRAHLHNCLDPPNTLMHRVDTTHGSLVCIVRSPVQRAYTSTTGEVSYVKAVTPRVWSEFPCPQTKDGDFILYLAVNGHLELVTLRALWEHILSPIDKLIMYVMLGETSKQRPVLPDILQGDTKVIHRIIDELARTYNPENSAVRIEPSKRSLHSHERASVS